MGFDDRLDNKGVERDSGLEAGWMVLPFTVIMNIEGCTDLVMNKMERRWRLFWIVLDCFGSLPLRTFNFHFNLPSHFKIKTFQTFFKQEKVK